MEYNSRLITQVSKHMSIINTTFFVVKGVEGFERVCKA